MGTLFRRLNFSVQELIQNLYKVFSRGIIILTMEKSGKLEKVEDGGNRSLKITMDGQEFYITNHQGIPKNIDNIVGEKIRIEYKRIPVTIEDGIFQITLGIGPCVSADYNQITTIEILS